MTEDTRQVISDFFEGCRTKDPRYDVTCRRIVMMTFLTPPGPQWEVILSMIEMATDDVLGHIAAGPIEGLLGRHGTVCIDRVKAEAHANPKFARALTGVWKHTVPDAVWERVKAAKDVVPPDQWLPAGIAERSKRSAG